MVSLSTLYSACGFRANGGLFGDQYSIYVVGGWGLGLRWGLGMDGGVVVGLALAHARA